ncbi:hypothetical protein AAFF_G00163920 [Aldrovandia affinis]|uniref:Uncharacterized protein n=1 Tax=Aldrovandia affinis TaxID=143900 RepID=A0AAD7WX73_9TELE|nr:hypothetical protein AAFF_G00163920 [Aldrovandia affinis]
MTPPVAQSVLADDGRCPSDLVPQPPLLFSCVFPVRERIEEEFREFHNSSLGKRQIKYERAPRRRGSWERGAAGPRIAAASRRDGPYASRPAAFLPPPPGPGGPCQHPIAVAPGARDDERGPLTPHAAEDPCWTDPHRLRTLPVTSRS